jgi:Fusaric acid resistance protein-like
LPAVLGVCLGRESVGLTASFGAYLVTITHADLPIKGQAQRLMATILMFCVGAIAGASAGQRVWIFLPLAMAAASWQAWTEIADTALRFPAAIAVLALLLSTGNVSPDLSVATYGAAFATGAIWQGLVQYVMARSGDMRSASLTSDFEALISSVVTARRFIVTMATLGAAGAAIVASLPMPHAAWLLTAALRVMKPSQAVTHFRLKHRLIGTVAGAIVSAGLLGWGLPPLLYAGLLGIMLTVTGWRPALRGVDVLLYRHCPLSRSTITRNRLARGGVSNTIDDWRTGSRQAFQFRPARPRRLLHGADCDGDAL